jgi:hypothetical protein
MAYDKDLTSLIFTLYHLLIAEDDLNPVTRETTWLCRYSDPNNHPAAPVRIFAAYTTSHCRKWILVPDRGGGEM